jgi:hypothetical protein
MRYWEIIEDASTSAAKKAQAVWRQTQKSSEALRKLRSKQMDAEDGRLAAKAMPCGPERARRLTAANRRDADARRVYGNSLNSANDAARKAMSVQTRP